jgi:hypothetical protein
LEEVVPFGIPPLSEFVQEKIGFIVDEGNLEGLVKVLDIGADRIWWAPVSKTWLLEKVLNDGSKFLEGTR